MAWQPPGYMPPMPPMGYGRPPMPFMRPPMGMHGGTPLGIPGLRPPTSLPPPPRAPPGAIFQSAPTPTPAKQFQAYVGKIPDGVPDGFIKNLLEQCGIVAKWERVTDPTSAKPKPFGFCKFVGADSVLRALRLLNGIEIDNGALLLKVDQKTQADLDEYEAEQRLAAAASESSAATSTETAKDEAAVKTIKELISNRAVTATPTSSSAEKEDVSRPREKSDWDREAEREERELERERERERRREREEESQFRDREREWERRETDKQREKDREQERESSRIKEKEKRQAECLSSEELDFDTWWHKFQDRSYQRKRVRDREAEDDDLDRHKEQEEAEEAGNAKGNDDEDDASGEDDADEGDGKSVKLTFGMGAAKKRRVDVFDKEEEEKETMKLVPIEYSEEEQRARDTLAQESGEKRTPEEKEAEMKRLIATIPIAKEDLLTYPVNWDIVDKGKLVEVKMAPWVSKKIADYLGEEEPMLIKYVLEMLTEHSTAQSIIEKLAVVLEDEAETFVIKLWRYLIFESMRHQAGL